MNKTNHYDLDDEEFEKAFDAMTLDPHLFSHEAHLRLAWIHVRKYGLAVACTNLRNQIGSFVQKLGASDKYHDTVTIASTKVVDHFIRRSKSSTFKDFISEFPRLKNNMKELLSQHYSSNILISEEARKTFMSPDKAPFD